MSEAKMCAKGKGEGQQCRMEIAFEGQGKLAAQCINDEGKINLHHNNESTSDPEGRKHAVSFAEEMPSLGIFFKSLSKRIMRSRCLVAHTGHVKPSTGKAFAGVFFLPKSFNMAVIQSPE